MSEPYSDVTEFESKLACLRAGLQEMRVTGKTLSVCRTNENCPNAKNPRCPDCYYVQPGDTRTAEEHAAAMARRDT